MRIGEDGKPLRGTLSKKRRTRPSAVAVIEDPVLTKHLRLSNPPFKGKEIGQHPARLELANRMTSARTFVRELAGRQKPKQPGKVVRDWAVFKTIKEKDESVAAFMLLDALSGFLAGEQRVAEVMQSHGVRELTTKSDFPDVVLDTIEKYHVGLEEIDLGWREIFDVIDFTNTTKSGFKIRDITSGLTFRKVPIGDVLDVFGMSGTEVEVAFDRYGAALGWDKTWFDDEEFWTVDETAIEYRRKFGKDQADTHYALLEALIGVNDIAWQAHPDGIVAGTAGYQVGRDVTTINKAIETIIEALKDQDMDVSPNETFILQAPTALRDRIGRALAARYSMATANGLVEVNSPVRPQYTTLLTDTTRYAVILPKRKLKSGIRMDLTVFSDTDILAYTEVTAGWARYGAGIGENDQVYWCQTA